MFIHYIHYITCIFNTLANNFDFGDVPIELKDLTPIEVRMISIYNSLTTIYKIRNGSKVSIGSVCYVVNYVGSEKCYLGNLIIVAFFMFAQDLKFVLLQIV